MDANAYARRATLLRSVLDDKDRLILRELREDSKKTTKTIAENTGIPRTTVHDRIHKMEQSGFHLTLSSHYDFQNC